MAAVYAGDIPDDGGAVSLLKPRVAGAGDITGLEAGRVGVFELEKVFAIDGAVGVEELVGDVGEHGGAAGGDAAFGDEDHQPGEELVDVDGGVELGEFGEEVGGEVFRVVLDGHRNGRGGVCLGVAEARARVSWQAGEAAALAVGIKIRTAGEGGFPRGGNGIGDETGANRCGLDFLCAGYFQRGLSRHMRVRFNAVVANANSAATFPSPRMRNRRMPRCSFKIPMTGSASAFRRRYNARPAVEANLLRMRRRAA